MPNEAGPLIPPAAAYNPTLPRCPAFFSPRRGFGRIFSFVNDHKTKLLLIYVFVQMSIDIYTIIQSREFSSSIPENDCSSFFNDEGNLKEPIKRYNILQWCLFSIMLLIYLRKFQVRCNACSHYCVSRPDQHSIYDYLFKMNDVLLVVMNIALALSVYSRFDFNQARWVNAVSWRQSDCQNSVGTVDLKSTICKRLICGFLGGNAALDMTGSLMIGIVRACFDVLIFKRVVTEYACEGRNLCCSLV